MDRVKTKSIGLSGKDFPTFLYDEGTYYDPDNVDSGLLKGQLLLVVSSHVIM